MTHPKVENTFPPAHLPVRPDWIEQSNEPILEPALPIVDPHHHLWDRPGQRYFFEDLLADVQSGHNIEATVFIQCRSMYRATGPLEMRPVGEVEYVNGVAAQSASGLYGPTEICAGIVGFADLMLGARVRPVLEAELAVAPDRFRGIRVMTAASPHKEIAPGFGKVPEGVMMTAAFREGFAELAPLGLSYDMWSFHPQMGEVVDLARSFPETSIIVNHAGGPLAIGPYKGRQDEVLKDWSKSMRELATCPNVTMKIGGLGMHIAGLDFHTRPMPPGSKELAQAWQPFVQGCIDAFGPARCMFESNFCVDKGTASYVNLWNAFKRLTQDFSAADKAHLFSETAKRVYRLK